ncbi:MAG: nucleotidyltransferase family protein [Pyrinomonadaceae bacterium]
MEFPANNHQSFFANPLRRAALNGIIYQQQIILAFQKLRENRIEPILIKGFSTERFYPASQKRKTADIDLCVPPEDYKKSQIIINELGFPPEMIDLHKSLRHLDKLPWDDLLKNSQLTLLHNVQIRVLRPEDGLRVTCIHWLNDGGADKEKLWDIYYLVANRPPDFDWKRCLNSNGRKRRQWILCAIAAAHHYLNLSVDETPFADEIETVLPDWFIPSLEKEWADQVKLIRLENFFQSRDWKSLRSQLKKRFSPNPIAASIATEAAFDNSSRLPFQIADFILRFIVHFGRNTSAVLKSIRTKPQNSQHSLFLF